LRPFLLTFLELIKAYDFLSFRFIHEIKRTVPQNQFVFTKI